MNLALNAVRAGAALMVVLVHTRGYLLVPLSETSGSLLHSVTYAATGLGNGAVMVFFALSGYFVGGSVLRQFRQYRFNWTQYLIARSVRLLVVLVPALAVTLVADHAGMMLFSESPNYTSGAPAIENGSATDLVGNALLLQSWIVPPFGSNGALWSLAYEWAYYLLFPLALALTLKTGASLWARIRHAGLFIAVGAVAGPYAVALFTIWVLGALVAWKEDAIAARMRTLRPTALAALRIFAVSGTLAFGVLDRIQDGSSRHIPFGTVACGIAAAGLIAVFVTDHEPKYRPGRRVMAIVSGPLAESSYSLYAFHMPVLVLLATALSPSSATNRFLPSLTSWALVIAVTSLLVLGGWLFAHFTERHHHKIRNGLIGYLQTGSARYARSANVGEPPQREAP